MATGTVSVDGTEQTFDGNGYFTGPSSYSITLSGKTGHTRTWTVSRYTEYFTDMTFFTNTLPEGTTSYDVYIHNWTDGAGTRYYANTQWYFTKSDQVNQYTFRYDADGGLLSGGEYTTAGTYNYNKLITLPTTKTKTGHTFHNFSVGGTTTSANSFNLQDYNTIVKANWTINTYTLSYTNNDGTLSGGTAAGTHNYNTTIRLPTTKTKTGYTFNNFTKNGTAISGTSFNLPAGDTTVVANWTIRKYTVTYSSSTPSHFNFTSSPGSYDFNTLLTATTITINPPRVIGQEYSFNKWNYNGNDLGTTRLPATNISLMAIWTYNNNDEIQISELSKVFDNSNSYQDIKISNYFDQLQLTSTNDKENIKFSTKLKGKGTF